MCCSISLRDMPDLCSKGVDLGMKPSAPSCPPNLPLYPGLQTESQLPPVPAQKGCLSRNPNWDSNSPSRGPNNPWLVMTSDYTGFKEIQTVEVREAQTAVRWVQRENEWAGSQSRKRKFIRGKRESDWLLRRTSVLSFWWSPSYTNEKFCEEMVT